MSKSLSGGTTSSVKPIAIRGNAFGLNKGGGSGGILGAPNGAVPFILDEEFVQSAFLFWNQQYSGSVPIPSNFSINSGTDPQAALHVTSSTAGQPAIIADGGLVVTGGITLTGGIALTGTVDVDRVVISAETGNSCLYLGSENEDGKWRLCENNGSLEFQRHDAGSYTTKYLLN